MLDPRATPPSPPSRSWWPPTTAPLRLAQLLQGLRGQTLPPERFEVIVVDDGSADATQDVLARERNRRGACASACRLRAEHGGPAAARNSGWRLARAPARGLHRRRLRAHPRLARDASRRGSARAAATRSCAGARCPTPPRRTRWAVLQDRGHQRAQPALRDLQRRPTRGRCSSGSTASTSPTRARPARTPTSAARAVAAGGVPAFAPDALVHHAVSARGPWAALATRSSPRRRARVQATTRPAPVPALRVFYDRSHPLLLLAFAGAAHAPPPAAALLSLPYAWHTAQRLRHGRPPASRGLLRRCSTRSSWWRRCAARCAIARSFSDGSGRSPVPSGAGTRMARDGEAVVAVVERTL